MTTDPHASTIPAPAASYVDGLATTTPRHARAIHSQERLGRYRILAGRHAAYALAILEIGDPTFGDLRLRARVALARWRLYDWCALGIGRRPPADYLGRYWDAVMLMRSDMAERGSRIIPLDVLTDAAVRPMRSAADNPSIGRGA